MRPEIQLTSVDVAIVIIALGLWLGVLPTWLRRDAWSEERDGLRRWMIMSGIVITIALLTALRVLHL
jgi:hypothetical protein